MMALILLQVERYPKHFFYEITFRQSITGIHFVLKRKEIYITHLSNSIVLKKRYLHRAYMYSIALKKKKCTWSVQLFNCLRKKKNVHEAIFAVPALFFCETLLILKWNLLLNFSFFYCFRIVVFVCTILTISPSQGFILGQTI